MTISIENYDVIIGIDPGLSGAICVMSNGAVDPEIFDVPVVKIANPSKISKTKTKSDIDIAGLVAILSKYRNKKVLVNLEVVHCMPSNGAVSMFNFGVGYGIFKGIIHSLYFELKNTSPQSWKKHFSALETAEMTDLKNKISDLRKSLKISKDKSIKKIIDKYNKEIKALAKNSARELAGKLYPSLIDDFKLKKNDGRAEALLICEFARENYALVQKSKT